MFFCIIKIWANALILVIYLESFISCNELTYVITGTVIQQFFFIFVLFFIYPYLFAFFFLFWRRIFLFCIKKAKKIEKYEMCVW